MPRARPAGTITRLALGVFVLQLVASAATVVYLRQALVEGARAERAREVEVVEARLVGAWYDGGRPALVRAITASSANPEFFLALSGPGGAPVLVNLVRVPVITAGPAHGVRILRQGDPRAGTGIARVRVLAGGDRLVIGAVTSGERALRRAFAETLVLTIVLAVLLAAMSALVLGYLVERRTRGLAETAARLASGDFAARVPAHRGGDGFDSLRLQMNRMAERIDRLVSELRSISGTLAHDLRSPVARLAAALDTAAAASDDPAARDAIQAARADADGLRAMLETALELARLEGGAVTDRRVPLDLAELAGDLVELYEPLADQAGVEIVTDLLPVIALVDRELLSRALANLIDNALKYGGRCITVSTRAADDMAELVVADDGAGIAPADRGRAVERFTRLDNARTQPGGGLGLAMVAAVAHLHGGNLALDGRSDGGSGLVTTLRLPLAAATAEEGRDR